MNYLNTFANTTYGDFKGKISIDFHGISENLFSLCKDNGIDMDKNFPFGLSFYGESVLEMSSEKNDEITLTIYTLPTSDYGSTFEKVANTLNSNEGIANAEKHRVSLKRSEIGKYFKRLSFMAVSDLRDHISEIKIVE